MPSIRHEEINKLWIQFDIKLKWLPGMNESHRPVGPTLGLLVISQRLSNILTRVTADNVKGTRANSGEKFQSMRGKFQKFKKKKSRLRKFSP